MKILYPNTFKTEGLEVAGHELCIYDPYQPMPAEHEDAEVMVVWQDKPAYLADTAKRLKKLKFIQSYSSGVEKILEAGFADDVIVASGKGLHDKTVAEHALCLILACARRTHLFYKAQKEHRWAKELGGSQPVDLKNDFRTLRNANVLIWGYGSIAQTITPYLTMLGAKVRGVANSAKTVDGVQVYLKEQVDSILPETDVLLMILPKSKETDNLLNAQRLALLPSHAWVVNVGRGNSIDETALADAVKTGVIAGAALDVFDTEPLPADSPFWDMSDNIIISPHAAGGRPYDGVERFNENFRRFLSGKPLINVK